MMKVMHNTGDPYSPSHNRTLGAAGYLNVYLSSKILKKFCNIVPLSPSKVHQIAQSGDLSLLFEEGQTSLGSSIARRLLLPQLQKHLPGIIETGLENVQSVAKQSLPFPQELFHSTLREVSTFYSDVTRAYREVAVEPFLTMSVEKSVAQKLQCIYANEGDLLTLSIEKLLREKIFKHCLNSIPWPFKAAASAFLHPLSFCLRHLLKLLSFSMPTCKDPIEDQLEILVKIAVCRFLKDLTRAVKQRSANISFDRRLLETCLLKHVLILRLDSCTSQEQIEKVLNNHAIWQRAVHAAIPTIAKEIETMVGTAWSVLENPSWREKEVKHFLQCFNDFFEHPERVLEQPSDVALATQELLEELLGQKLPQLLHFTVKPLAKYIATGRSIVMETLIDFWSKPCNLRFGLLHRQILMRWVHSST